MSSTPSFNAANVSRNTWIALGGGAVLLISTFLNWYSVSASVGGFSASVGGSGWSSGSLGKLTALVAVVAVGAIAAEIFGNVTLPVPSALVGLGCGALAVLMVIVKFISKPGGDLADAAGLDVSLSFGIFVALLAAIALTAGSYLRMNEA